MISKTLILILTTFDLFLSVSAGKVPITQKGLLWEISGKDLSNPSYIFGTYWLINPNHLDNLAGWKAKFEKCNMLVGEVLLDSNTDQIIAPTLVMNNNTIEKLLSPEEYERTNKYFMKVTGLPLSDFNNLRPLVLSNILTLYNWTNQNPESLNVEKVNIDIYIQKLGRTSKKRFTPLESFEEQASIWKDKISLNKQKEMLLSIVNNQTKISGHLVYMDKYYREQDLDNFAYSYLAKDWGYDENWRDILVKERNRQWVPRIESIIKKEPAMIAVNTINLSGKDGLINLLKQKGYSVKPININ